MEIEILKGVIPDIIVGEIQPIIDTFQIDTPLRLSHFLAQAAVESEDFKEFYEDLNYSEAGLNAIFPSHFPNGLAANYARQPEKIANHVYAGRYGNGDESTGDGWKYRGRGAFGLTFFDNYRDFGKAIDVDVITDPDLVATKYPLLSAAWYWKIHSLNQMADKGGADEVISITKEINGGVNGLSQRIEWFNKFYSILNPAT